MWCLFGIGPGGDMCWWHCPGVGMCSPDVGGGCPGIGKWADMNWLETVWYCPGPGSHLIVMGKKNHHPPVVGTCYNRRNLPGREKWHLVVVVVVGGGGGGEWSERYCYGVGEVGVRDGSVAYQDRWCWCRWACRLW